jgi:hypothetical protein
VFLGHARAREFRRTRKRGAVTRRRYFRRTLTASPSDTQRNTSTARTPNMQNGIIYPSSQFTRPIKCLQRAILPFDVTAIPATSQLSLASPISASSEQVWSPDDTAAEFPCTSKRSERESRIQRNARRAAEGSANWQACCSPATRSFDPTISRCESIRRPR